jgi:hypothetical protein
MTNTDYCCVCEFCGSADNHWSRMYWVQGAIYLVDEPNCCEECVEYDATKAVMMRAVMMNKY